MTLEENKQVLRELYEEIFQKHRLDLVDRFIADDYVQHNPDLPAGKAGFVEFHVDFFTAMPDAFAAINEMVAERDLVWVYNTITGTHTGPGIAGLPPTGNQIRYDVVDMFRLRDGKLVDHWDVADTRALFTQAGGLAPVER
jgi:predicted SnoaL-like aldol condensation-catalyzing enzyme